MPTLETPSLYLPLHRIDGGQSLDMRDLGMALAAMLLEERRVTPREFFGHANLLIDLAELVTRHAREYGLRAIPEAAPYRRLVGQHPSAYIEMRRHIPDLAAAVCPPEFAQDVREIASTALR